MLLESLHGACLLDDFVVSDGKNRALVPLDQKHWALDSSQTLS